MQDIDGLVAAFHGGDPIRGREALHTLLALGDAGEAALFARPLSMPTLQVERRWQKYVATRPNTCGPRLLASVCDAGFVQGGYHEAGLLAALPDALGSSARVATALNDLFRDGNTPNVADNDVYRRATTLLRAWGAVGHDAYWPWRLVSRDHYAWEKLRSHAFEAACAMLARSRGDQLQALADFVTHRWPPDGRLELIREQPGSAPAGTAIENQELWFQSYYIFPRWRSGDLVDAILTTWSRHPHWRVRAFGAQILAGLGFWRAVRTIAEWLAREPVPRVRQHLVAALGSTDHPGAADALLECLTDDAPRSAGEDEQWRAAFAAVGWKSSDTARAADALRTMAARMTPDGSEALVALARMGERASNLDEALVATDHYRRLNAALAAGLLGESDRAGELRTLLAESSGQLEPVYVCAALTLLGETGSAEQLHGRLVALSGPPGPGEDQGEIFRLKRALQQAVLAAFRKAGAPARHFLDAWGAEFEPLEIRVTAVSLAAEGAAAPTPSAAAPAEAAHDLFISHASEDKPAIVLPLHEALVAQGLRVWLDSLELTLGDSLRRRIDDGLAKSRFGVVVLSPSFFAKEWPQRELDALFARETVQGRKTILPVLHGMDHAELTRIAPTLADRKLVRSDAGLPAVVAAIIAAVQADRRR